MVVQIFAHIEQSVVRKVVDRKKVAFIASQKSICYDEKIHLKSEHTTRKNHKQIFKMFDRFENALIVEYFIHLRCKMTHKLGGKYYFTFSSST